jgi:hypothetical protein
MRGKEKAFSREGKNDWLYDPDPQGIIRRRKNLLSL